MSCPRPRSPPPTLAGPGQAPADGRAPDSGPVQLPGRGRRRVAVKSPGAPRSPPCAAAPAPFAMHGCSPDPDFYQSVPVRANYPNGDKINRFEKSYPFGFRHGHLTDAGIIPRGG